MNTSINSLKKLYVMLGPSKKHGVGVFSMRSIPKDTLLFVGDMGVTIPLKLLKSSGVHADTIKFLKMQCCSSKSDITVDTSYDVPSYHLYLNHSKNPNVIETTHNNKVYYYSNRRIKKGDELLINYENDYCAEKIDFKIN